MNQSDIQQQTASQGMNRTINMAEIALRGTSTLIDIQLAAFRNVARIQSRSAALLGLPDCSELFNAADKLIQCQLSAATDQLLSSTHQVSQACAETQRQFGRAIQKGTSQLTQEIRQSVEEVGERTRQSMQEFTDMAQRQANEAERGFENMGDEMQSRGGNGQSEESADMRLRQTEESNRKSPQSRKHQ